MTIRATAALAALPILVAACAAEIPEVATDLDRNPDEGVEASGKGDGIDYHSDYAFCELMGVAQWLNDGDATPDAGALQAGCPNAPCVWTSVANRMIAYRNGPNGIFEGTASGSDDNLFDDIGTVRECYGTPATAVADGAAPGITELDDVCGVGRYTMDRLVQGAHAVGRVNPNCLDTAADGDIGVIFSPHADFADTHLAATARAIDEVQAGGTLDIAIYSFRPPSSSFGPDGRIVQPEEVAAAQQTALLESPYAILHAIERAASRGVSVRMILEGARDLTSLSRGLELANVDVRYVNKTMHNKFIILNGYREVGDDPAAGTLFNGSGNWSGSAGTLYNENTLVVRHHAETLLLFQQEFNRMWDNSRDVAHNPALVYFNSAPVTDDMIAAVDDPGVEVRFTGENYRVSNSSAGPSFTKISGLELEDAAATSTLVRYIDAAETSVHVAEGHFLNPPVQEALMRAHERGLEVNILLDAQEFRPYDSLAYKMAVAGADVRYKVSGYWWHYLYVHQMHNKYVIIDGQTVLTGSFNLSTSSEFTEMENLVALSGPAYADLVADYEADFASIWNLGREEGLYEAVLRTVRCQDGTFPIVWDNDAGRAPPMTLTHQENAILGEDIRQVCPAVDDYRLTASSHRYCDHQYSYPTSSSRYTESCL